MQHAFISVSISILIFVSYPFHNPITGPRPSDGLPPRMDHHQASDQRADQQLASLPRHADP